MGVVCRQIPAVQYMTFSDGKLKDYQVVYFQRHNRKSEVLYSAKRKL